MHCSLELLWMMLGYAINDKATFARELIDRGELETACGKRNDELPAGSMAWGWIHPRTGERGPRAHLEDVTCPNCLVRMDEAMQNQT